MYRDLNIYVDLIFSSLFLSPSTAYSLDLYDEAGDSTYAYATSIDGLFSDGTTIIYELHDSDELGALSPDSNLALDADI